MTKHKYILIETIWESKENYLSSASEEDVKDILSDMFEDEDEMEEAINSDGLLYLFRLNCDDYSIFELDNSVTSAEYLQDERVVIVKDRGKEYKIYANGKVSPSTNNHSVKEIIDFIDFYNKDDTFNHEEIKLKEYV